MPGDNNIPLSIRLQLRHWPQLAAINDPAWNQALAESVLISCPAGTRLIECGNTADKFVIVLQGTINVYENNSNGREISLYRVHGGQVCVLTLTRLLQRSNSNAQATAETDVQLLAFPPRYFDRLLAESEMFRRFLMSAMASCITEVTQLIADISFNSLDCRLVRILCRRRTESSNPLRVTHQAIANELGTTREVVSRMLKNLERAGHIRLQRGSIEIIDLDELELRCQ